MPRDGKPGNPGAASSAVPRSGGTSVYPEIAYAPTTSTAINAPASIDGPNGIDPRRVTRRSASATSAITPPDDERREQPDQPRVEAEPPQQQPDHERELHVAHAHRRRRDEREQEVHREHRGGSRRAPRAASIHVAQRPRRRHEQHRDGGEGREDHRVRQALLGEVDEGEHGRRRPRRRAAPAGST